MRTRLALLVVIIIVGSVWTIWHGYQKGWFARYHHAFEKRQHEKKEPVEHVVSSSPAKKREESPRKKKKVKAAKEASDQPQKPGEDIARPEQRVVSTRFRRDKTVPEDTSASVARDVAPYREPLGEQYGYYPAPSMPPSRRHRYVPGDVSAPPVRHSLPTSSSSVKSVEADGDALRRTRTRQAPEQEKPQPAGRVILSPPPDTDVVSDRENLHNRRLYRQVDELTVRNEALDKKLRARDREIEELKTLLTLLREESGKDLEFILNELERRGVTRRNPAS